MGRGGRKIFLVGTSKELVILLSSTVNSLCLGQSLKQPFFICESLRHKTQQSVVYLVCSLVSVAKIYRSEHITYKCLLYWREFIIFFRFLFVSFIMMEFATGKDGKQFTLCSNTPFTLYFEASIRRCHFRRLRSNSKIKISFWCHNKNKGHTCF